MGSEMPYIRDCTATGCAFNVRRGCRAEAITLGREGRAACKTFLPGGTSTRGGNGPAAVGACAMYMCLHNRDLMCMAYRIKVGIRQGRADCLTFKNRYKEATN